MVYKTFFIIEIFQLHWKYQLVDWVDFIEAEFFCEIVYYMFIFKINFW